MKKWCHYPNMLSPTARLNVVNLVINCATVEAVKVSFPLISRFVSITPKASWRFTNKSKHAGKNLSNVLKNELGVRNKWQSLKG
jgi:hypothetical protein